jgi:hypothetical protein
MIRFVADENFNNAITRGLLRRKPGLELIRVQDIGLRKIKDPELLDWAARNDRIVLSHDVTTLRAFAEVRVRNGFKMPGLFEASENLPVRLVIDDLLLVAECSSQEEWEGKIVFLPQR